MKKWMIGAVCGLMITGCSIESVEPEVKEEDIPIVETVIEFEPRNVEANYISIETKRLNVRTEADESSDDVGDVYENEKFQVISEEYDTMKRIWYEIRTEEGVTGFVAGWYCAETKITIRVEEDAATILEIDVLPIPQYVSNPFDEDDVSVGDQVVGHVIKEIAQIEDLTKIVFEGEVELTGSYYHENDGDLGKIIRFTPDEASSVLLPRITSDISSVEFVLSDYDKVSSNFGEIGTTGYATLTIDSYSIGFGTSKAYNQADMVKVLIE